MCLTKCFFVIYTKWYGGSAGKNMPRDFFGKFTPTTRLQSQIENCIQLFGKLEFDSDGLEIHLSTYKKILLNAMKNPLYPKLNLKIKNTVAETLIDIELMSENLEAETEHSPECIIQISSDYDLSQMHGMTAGGKEDQSVRLTNMVKVVQENTSMPIYSTDTIYLPYYWNLLFTAIDLGDMGGAAHLFQQIPKHDFILEPLLKVHSEEYLAELIEYSIKAQKTKLIKLNADVVLTPKTFEILIKDLATTLYNPAKISVSFGLPTHHAFSETGSGFCLINKTAVLMRHCELQSKTPLQYIIIGTDVNRDNGLCDILRQSASPMYTCHIDIFDSRVYPMQNLEQINDEFESKSFKIAQNQVCFHKHNFEYYPVDLSVTTRNNDEIHPALQFALIKVEEVIRAALFNGQKIAIFLPIGWDSHENETAYCGKFVKNHWLTKAEAKKSRFNDQDLEHFYTELFHLYHQNKEHIQSMYWGLEGGYDKAMYEQQIELLIQVIDKQMLHYDTMPHFGGM
jgi:acetoin utilization deacetylase AcuC-like enzyme